MLFNPVLTFLTFGSLPLHSWSWIWRPFRGPPPTCRPPQDTSTTVRTQFTARVDPRDLEFLKLNPVFLARYTAIGAPNWIWFCHLFYDSECIATECRPLESPTLARGCRQEWHTKPFLFAPQALKSCKPYNRRHSPGRGRVYTDANDRYQGSIRVKSLLL